MKRILPCLLAFLMVIGLAGCLQDAPELMPLQQRTAAPQTAQETARPDPEKETQDAPGDSDTMFWFSNELETRRIYRQGLDGEGLTLVSDVEASQVTELGDSVYFINGRKLCRCPKEGGAHETVFADYPVITLLKADDSHMSFICRKEDETGMPVNTFLYDLEADTGTCVRIAEELMSDAFATDGKIVYSQMDPETDRTVYVIRDCESGQEKTLKDVNEPIRFAADHALYAYGEDEAWFRYDLNTLEREAVDLNADDFDTFIASRGSCMLMQREGSLYRVDGKEREAVLSFGDSGYWISAVTDKDDTAVVRVDRLMTAEAFGEELSYQEYRYYAVSMTDWSAKDITADGAAGALFADGEFPQMDVSTARKPLTKDLSLLFFRQYGEKGREPLNSKSHGAWLNLADRGCDLILVPAPTDEEKAYLAEKQVEVDMKVFGADGLIFIAGTGSGVTSLTIDEIKGIYRGEITNWKEVGGVDHPITVFYRNDQSGSQRQFEKLVWKDDPVPDFSSKGFRIMDNMISIVWECQQDPYAIGYSIMTYLSDVFGNGGVTLVGIDGITPSPGTVNDGSYPLTLQDCVVIRSDEPENSPARRLYDWFGTPQSDDLLIRNGLTPVRPVP